jgi:hypothetical protein
MECLPRSGSSAPAARRDSWPGPPCACLPRRSFEAGRDRRVVHREPGLQLVQRAGHPVPGQCVGDDRQCHRRSGDHGEHHDGPRVLRSRELTRGDARPGSRAHQQVLRFTADSRNPRPAALTAVNESHRSFVHRVRDHPEPWSPRKADAVDVPDLLLDEWAAPHPRRVSHAGVAERAWRAGPAAVAGAPCGRKLRPPRRR